MRRRSKWTSMWRQPRASWMSQQQVVIPYTRASNKSPLLTRVELQMFVVSIPALASSAPVVVRSHWGTSDSQEERPSSLRPSRLQPPQGAARVLRPPCRLWPSSRRSWWTANVASVGIPLWQFRQHYSVPLQADLASAPPRRVFGKAQVTGTSVTTGKLYL